jgi:hypothetical protein
MSTTRALISTQIRPPATPALHAPRSGRSRRQPVQPSRKGGESSLTDEGPAFTRLAEVERRLAGVHQSAASLQTAVGGLPSGAHSDLVSTQQQLQTAAQRARDAVDQLGAAADTVTDSTTAVSLAPALVTLNGHNPSATS